MLEIKLQTAKIWRQFANLLGYDVNSKTGYKYSQTSIWVGEHNRKRRKGRSNAGTGGFSL